MKGTPANTGLCPDCMNHLQRWHVFNCAIAKRHEEAKNTGAKVIEEKVNLKSFEGKVYKNYKKIGRGMNFWLKWKTTLLVMTQVHN